MQRDLQQHCFKTTNGSLVRLLETLILWIIPTVVLVILFAIISQPDIWKSAGTSSAEVAAISNKQAKNSGGNEGDWTNPCGIVLFPDSLLLHQHPRHSHNYHLLLQLNMTLRRIQLWVDDFTIKKFHMTFEQKYAEDEGKYYSWLLVSSVVPNTTAVFLRHQTSIQTLVHTDHFKTISVHKFLYQGYDMLQRFAIAWEQVTIEKDIYFQDKFNETLIFNMLTLCEFDLVLMAVVKDGYNIPSNTRTVMPQVLRHLRYTSDKSTRNFRFLKDYIRALQYLINGFYFYYGQLEK